MSKKNVPAVWVYADPLEKLNLSRDSTLFWISLLSDVPVFWIEKLNPRTVEFRRIGVHYSALDFTTEPNIILGARETLAWPAVRGKFLFRLDPPVDARYRLAANLIVTCASPELQLINNPITVSTLSEKLLPLIGQDEIPFQLEGSVRAGQVVKSLWGFGGADVRIEKTANYMLGPNEIAQDFAPEISDGERRVYIVGGQLHGILKKTPSAEDFRSNFRWGAGLSLPKPKTFEIKKAKFYQAWLRARGVHIATVDFIGRRIVEINITCPGLLYPTALLQGHTTQRLSPLARALKNLARP